MLEMKTNALVISTVRMTMMFVFLLVDSMLMYLTCRHPYIDVGKSALDQLNLTDISC